MRAAAVDLGVEVRLLQNREYSEIGSTANVAHPVADLSGDSRKDFKIWPEHFYRVDRLDAGHALPNVVVNALRQIEIHAGQLAQEIHINALGKNVLGDARRP